MASVPLWTFIGPANTLRVAAAAAAPIPRGLEATAPALETLATRLESPIFAAAAALLRGNSLLHTSYGEPT
jgi:hypothetical protein